MSPAAPSRPRQVTVAAWLIMLGSAAVVLAVFDRLSGLHSLETREAVQRFLAGPPGSGLDLGVDGVISVLRTVSMVAAGCATAAAILGYQVLRRSRSARLMLTVLAVPLFVAGLVTGGFLSSLVAVSAAMLWLQPARAWFRDAPSPSAPPAPTAEQRSREPEPRSPYAASRGRPAALVWACALTWVFTVLAVATLVGGAVALVAEPDTLLDQVHRQNPELATQGISDDLLVGVAFAMVAGIVLWCLAAAVLAVLAFRGVEWARIALVVSAATTAALCLLGSLVGGFVLVLPLVASVVAAALLVRPEVRSWFAERR